MEDEFQNSLVSADVVAVPYRKSDRPSGIISRCIAWGIPIIASNHGWPLWACEQFDAGLACDTTCDLTFANGIESVLSSFANFQPSDSARRFAKFNTVENFQGFWVKGICETLGRTPTFISLDSKF